MNNQEIEKILDEVLEDCGGEYLITDDREYHIRGIQALISQSNSQLLDSLEKEVEADGKEEDIAKAKQKTPYYTDKKDFYGITVYGLEDAETYTFSLDDITDIIKNNL